MPKARVSSGFSVAARIRAPSIVRSINQVDGDAHRDADYDREEPIGRIEGEAEIRRARKQRGRLVRRAQRSGRKPHPILDDEHEREGEEQIVERVQVVKAPQERHFDQEAEETDEDRRDDECRKERQVDELRAVIRDERTQHIHRSLREIHDSQHAEDDAQTDCQ